MKNPKSDKKATSGMTLIELLVVTAIITVLMGLTLPYVRSSREQVLIGIAKSQIRSINTALAAYKSGVGYYPIDPSRVFGADIPECLFAALHNKSTRTLGGYGEQMLYDAEPKYIGILNGHDDSASGAGGSRLNAKPLGGVEHSTARFQLAHTLRQRKLKSLVEASGLPVFTDPWGNAWHYREWSSKRADLKMEAANSGFGVDACQHRESYDLWSNGPDGINNFGAPDSDDIAR